jgi:hypothetical protein
MPRIETPLGPWEAAPLDAVVALFQKLAAPWWVSGGYAIELAVGRAYREHGDVDINVLRRDQMVVRALLADWDVHAADPPGELRPWPLDEPLPAHVHDIWVREHPGGPWRFQLMLDEADGDEWVYRRDARIRRPLASVGISAQGFLRLTPEIQLLFKAKSTRPKDELDFEQVLPHLTRELGAWLYEALATEHGRHPWQERLGT